MKKNMLLAAACTLLFCTAIFAQKVNTDSLSLVAKISENQLKLGKLENEVEQKTKNKTNAADQAQKSANANATAANNLSNDPSDQKLARQADNKASDAKGDARTARKDAKRLDDLNKSIIELKSKIAQQQIDLSKYTGTTVVSDSTHVH